MKPVGCRLDFTFQGDKSWFIYFADHFGSYCLVQHNCKEAAINRIGGFCLRQKYFQFLDHFTIEIWFSLPISCCMQSNAELYTERDMMLDTDDSTPF